MYSLLSEEEPFLEKSNHVDCEAGNSQTPWRRVSSMKKLRARLPQWVVHGLYMLVCLALSFELLSVRFESHRRCLERFNAYCELDQWLSMSY